MNKKILIGVALSAILIGSAGFVYAQKTAADNASKQTVALKNMSGAAVSLEDFKGKVTVLSVGATWLPLSREQIAIVNRLSQDYKSRGAAIYFVSTDSADQKSKNFADDARVKLFAERNKLAAPILRDAAGTIVSAFKLDQIPAFVILNKNGEVAATIVGLDVENNAAASAQIAAEIDKVLDK